MSAEGQVSLTREGTVATVLFDRPAARNAMTSEMYARFDAICAELAGDASLRAVVLRGAGGKAFVAGTDIARFLDFETGEEGVAYERKMDSHMAGLAAIPVPTLAVIEGSAVGGGLAMAASCDIRIATPDARFGVPIARTLGNCLSIVNYARLLAGFGEGRAKRMLLLGDLLDAEEALAAGFLTRIVPREALEEEIAAITTRLVENAPLTMKASKEALRRLGRHELPEADDLIARVYASTDFKIGVRAFLAREKPDWKGE